MAKRRSFSRRRLQTKHPMVPVRYDSASGKFVKTVPKVAQELKRKFGGVTKVAFKRRKMAGGTVGSQWTRSSMRTGRFKRGRRLDRVKTKISGQRIVTRFRRLKNFDNFGALKGSRYVLADGYHRLPVWCFLLNGQNNGDTNYYPFRRLCVKESTGGGVNDGQLTWAGVNNILSTGSQSPQYETLNHNSGGLFVQEDRALWRASDIKLNLWGAKNKAIRYSVQICKVTDHRVSPFNHPITVQTEDAPSGAVNAEAQQTWEEMVKHYCYNPISTLNWFATKRIKVLKSFETIIQPNSTTDGDADPHCHTLRWNTKWDRVVNYTDLMANSSGQVAQLDDANLYSEVEQNRSISTRRFTPSGTEPVFLLVRMSNYTGAPSIGGEGFDEGLHGSFDVDIRSSFYSES